MASKSRPFFVVDGRSARSLFCVQYPHYQEDGAACCVTYGVVHSCTNNW
jgi:hypothetical protein